MAALRADLGRLTQIEVKPFKQGLVTFDGNIPWFMTELTAGAIDGTPVISSMMARVFRSGRLCSSRGQGKLDRSVTAKTLAREQEPTD